MLRLALLVVLIVATTSARHVKKVRRDEIDSSICFGATHPGRQCTPTESEYPLMTELGNARNFTTSKQILLRDGSLESLCEEGKNYFKCVVTALQSASADCQQLYEELGHINLNNVAKYQSIVEDLCEDNIVENAKENLDCILDSDLLHTIHLDCSYENPDHDCSELDDVSFEDRDDDFYTARNECYDIKYRRNCNAHEVVQCASDKMDTACGHGAGDLIVDVGRAIFDKLPICPDYGEFRRMLKFFKK